MTIPSALLKFLGILLVMIGLAGAASGILAVKLVYEYNIEAATTTSIKESISEATSGMETNRRDINGSISNTSKNLGRASASAVVAGEKTGSAAEALRSASSDLTNAANSVRVASTSSKDAARDLRDGAQTLRAWSDIFRLNGSELPGKATFQFAADRMISASSKFEDSGARLEATASNLDRTASNIDTASLRFKESSAEQREMGRGLNQSKGGLDGLRGSMDEFISDVTVPLRESVNGIEVLMGLTPSIKLLAYGILAYLVVLHLIILGVGMAIIIIETNLFYTEET